MGHSSGQCLFDVVSFGQIVVFPSWLKGKHITGGLMNKQWVRARKKAGLPEDLVLYCARHDFGTYVLQKTGNSAPVMEQHGSLGRGHDVSAPGIERRDAINSRHILRHRTPLLSGPQYVRN